jgi:hypothetical protein
MEISVWVKLEKRTWLAQTAYGAGLRPKYAPETNTYW